MKKDLFFLFLSILFSSCSDNDDEIISACGVANPVEELAWLKAEIDTREANPSEDMKYCYITQGEYNGDIVFVYWDCNPLINKIIPVYDCEGTFLNNTNENQIPFDAISNQKIIWKTSDFVCEVDF